MAERLEKNLALIRSLVERAPDGALRDLASALSGDTSDGPLASVRAMVDAETHDRVTRDMALAPLKPLFEVRADGIEHLNFPRTALAGVWRAVRAVAPHEAAAAAVRQSDDDDVSLAWDELCRLAAQGLRERSTDAFAAVAAQLDQAMPDGSAQLAGCLDVAPVARTVLGCLRDWLHRMTDDRAAALRLAFKDAVDIAPDGGARLFEIVFSHLSEPWTVLRLIGAVIVRPGDNYVSSSEMAVFGERLLADIERRVAEVAAFDLDSGPEGAEALGENVRIAGAIIEEFANSLNLAREGPWGARLAKQRVALAQAVEAHLRTTDDALAAALPQAPLRLGGRTVRVGPKLDTPPDERLIRRARAAMALIEQVRRPSVNGGYNTLRLKTVEEVENRLNAYVEELLDALHHGDEEGIENARLYLDETADLIGRVRDDKAAQIVRRRAKAA